MMLKQRLLKSRFATASKKTSALPLSSTSLALRSRAAVRLQSPRLSRPAPADGSKTPIIRCQANPTSSASGTGQKRKKELKTLRVHYVRRAGDYKGWGLHTWGDVTHPTDWQRPLNPTGKGEGGTSVYWDVPLRPGSRFAGFLVHAGETKSARAEVDLDDLGVEEEVWLVGDEQAVFTGGVPDLTSIPVGSINKQAAIWVARDLIAWRHPLGDEDGPRSFVLHHAPRAGMWITAAGVQGGAHAYELVPAGDDLTPELATRWPHLKGCSLLRVPEHALEKVQQLVRGMLMLGMYAASGAPLDATGVQLQGALDDHYAYDGPLGAWPDPATGQYNVSVWAPTADEVALLYYGHQARGGIETVLPMQYGVLGPGVWSATLPKDALWSYYKYRVTVYCSSSVRTEVVEATDPYARGLSADGERVCVVPPDLNHDSLKPAGWDAHTSPTVPQWTDISIYELHIRDFSAIDESVPAPLRGKYGAFVPEKVAAGGGGGYGANSTSAGLAHLTALREAGLNHLHLLPTYDFGSVPERAEDQAVLTVDLSNQPPDSEVQQQAVLAIADRDGFNWGYDPVHYGVPDGSYAQSPDGPPRLLEFREMVQALHAQGWRVVLDVVYNHTFSSGPHNKYSVLDKIVPGYYHRRYEDGELCHSTCCNNTATEHYMCERLVVDDIVHWAKHYRIDSFRFDIMGHLMVSTLRKMRAGLDALTLEKDGVDGRAIYIYGEAWDFGEVLNGARGVNCGQMNLAGTGLGAFNDRLRDGALGGGPFAPFDFQGLVTGLSLAPNGSNGQGPPPAQLAELLILSDWVRYSMAGNLRAYPMETCSGRVATGEQAQAHGLPLAYGGLPHEHVAFIGCHDNLTMFDFITEKAPSTAFAEERMRMQVLCLGLIALSQGVPFFHAGDDLLRSKSLDRDSYNSGDWFNAVDWTANTHKLGIGLPVHTKNGGSWHYKRKLLANPMIRPTPVHMRTATAIFQQLLRIRYSSPLFRLATTEAVIAQVKHHNTGPNQVPGVIVMELVSAAQAAAGPHAVYDPTFERLVVVANCAPLEQEVPFPTGARHLQLHPLQQAPGQPDPRLAQCTADDSTRTLTVAARTVAVYVEPRQ